MPSELHIKLKIFANMRVLSFCIIFHIVFFLRRKFSKEMQKRIEKNYSMFATVKLFGEIYEPRKFTFSHPYFIAH